MTGRTIRANRFALLLLVVLGSFSGGCQHTVRVAEADLNNAPLPRELDKQTLPDYVIEPPDILLIDAISVVPIRVSAGDVLFIHVTNAFETRPSTTCLKSTGKGMSNSSAITEPNWIKTANPSWTKKRNPFAASSTTESSRWPGKRSRRFARPW